MANTDQAILAEITFPSWIPFNGVAVADGEQFLLRARSGGSIRMNKSDVFVHDGTVSLRDNARAEIVEKPLERALIGVEKLAISANGCVHQEDCPSRCCACIGFVRVCCGSGGTRGVCLGVWSCPG